MHAGRVIYTSAMSVRTVPALAWRPRGPRSASPPSGEGGERRERGDRRPVLAGARPPACPTVSGDQGDLGASALGLLVLLPRFDSRGVRATGCGMIERWSWSTILSSFN
jgi:hypothetical protein